MASVSGSAPPPLPIPSSVRAATLALPLLLLFACGESRSAPPAAESPADPRLPRGFDVPVPEGATARWGATANGRATAVLTTERAPEAVLDGLATAFAARGWSLERDAERLIARRDGRERARAEVTRGASGLVRVTLSEPRTGRSEVELEPRAWRRVERAPLPAPAGEAVRECAAAMLAACEAWAAAGGEDALDCALDHRGACTPTEWASMHERAVDDAAARVAAALRAHDQVGSPAARAETEALVRLERLAARSVVARAESAGLRVPREQTSRLDAARVGSDEDVDVRAWWDRNTRAEAGVRRGEPAYQEPR